MGHKIKYGAKFFLKIKYFPYLPTHFLGGHVTGNQHIIYFGLTSGGKILFKHVQLVKLAKKKMSSVPRYNWIVLIKFYE